MRVTAVPVTELGAAELERWRAIQAAHEPSSSPYLAPEFALAAAAEGRPVRVGVMEDGAGIVGFFPHERGRYGMGSPAGGLLSLGHGVIAHPDVRWSPRELLRACGLVRWDFAHLVDPGGPMGPYSRLRLDNPLIDVSRGFDCYLAERRRELVVTTLRKARKAERELGPLRFEARSSDTCALDALMRWKSVQYRAIGTRDRFALDWSVRLVRRIHATRSADFEGLLSTLHIGDDLAAAHIGIRLGRVWSYWFPAYDAALGRYSPGVILLLRMAESAEALGAREIQLGAGREAYKWHLANRSRPIGEGRVETPSPGLLVLKAARTAGRVRQSVAAAVRPGA